MLILRVILLLSLAVLLAQPSDAQAKIPYTPVISYITPNQGSLAGGTQIVIVGSGFSRNGVQGVFDILYH